MNNVCSYRIYLDNIRCRPFIDDSMTKELEKESGQEFFRPKINGKFKFMRVDYDYILAQDKNHKFNVLIQANFGYGYYDYFKGLFYITDCEIDYDKEIISVQPELDDDYKLILDSIDKEFDLIKLAPEIISINAMRRGVIQVYISGADTLTNIIGSTFWEQPCTAESDHSTLVNDYKFFGSQYYFPVIPANVECKGMYKISNYKVDDDMVVEWTDLTNTYKIKRFYNKVNDVMHIYFRVYKISNMQALYQSRELVNLSDYSSPFGIDFYDIKDTFMSTIVFNCTGFRAYIRILTNNYIQGASSFMHEIPEADIVEKNQNYKYIYNSYVVMGSGIAVWDSIQNMIMATSEYSMEATEFGQFPESDYVPNNAYFTNKFTIPMPYGDWKPIFPICKSNWGNCAIFMKTPTVYTLPSTQYTNIDSIVKIRVAYKLSSVINRLLYAMGSTVIHTETSDCSELLYGTNPIAPEKLILAITPKSNVVNTQYDKPAWKAPIRLSEVLNMLRILYDIKWHVKNGKLVLENYKYYNNGGSYTGIPPLGLDINRLIYRKNKTWDINNVCSFSKAEMPERYQFKFMDTQTLPFENLPLVVKSPYVQTGNTQDESISNFSGDIDMMLAAPDQISKDGFALFSCDLAQDGTYSLPMGHIVIKDIDYYVQNYRCAFGRTVGLYKIYNLPAESVNINGEDCTIDVYKRFKTQKVMFPVVEDVDPFKMIKTSVGTGNVEKLSINLLKRFVTGTIKHNI